MKTKFKIGQEVFFMKHGKPQKKAIKGLANAVGEFADIKTPFGNTESTYIVYSFDTYTYVKENDVFETKGELRDHLFKNL